MRDSYLFVVQNVELNPPRANAIKGRRPFVLLRQLTTRTEYSGHGSFFLA